MEESKDKTLITTYIAGVQHHAGYDLTAELAEGDVCQLRREPENPYDQFATEVFAFIPSNGGPTKLGYIPKEFARVTSNLLNNDIALECVCTRAQLGKAAPKIAISLK